jgi:hypothetical protein
MGSTSGKKLLAVATFDWIASAMPSLLPSPVSTNGGTPSPSSTTE